MKTVIIIPARMASKRFPNKPMALVDNVPMIQRVWERAIKSEIGETYVACSEKEVFDLIDSLGGNAIMTDPSLPSGTDRVFDAFKKVENFQIYDSIINLQGDMPLINPNHIKKVNEPLLNGFDIGTLATNLSKEQKKDINITKVKIEWHGERKVGKACNFYKIPRNDNEEVYQHVGIYSFRTESLKKFVSFPQSENELKFNLEQWRAIDFGISIGAIYADNVPISVDTKEDLKQIESIIKSAE